MKYILIPVLAVAMLFSSCATFQNFQQFLGTPAAVQADIILLGGVAKSHIPAEAQARIHQFATYLNQAADLNLDSLFALLPQTTGSVNGDALISAAKAYLTATVQRYGTHNQTTIAYAHAVAAGLLANF